MHARSPMEQSVIGVGCRGRVATRAVQRGLSRSRCRAALSAGEFRNGMRAVKCRSDPVTSGAFAHRSVFDEHRILHQNLCV